MNSPTIRSHSATTTTSKILEQSKNRKAVLIYNNGASIAYLTSNRNQGTADGIPIAVNGSYANDHFNAQGDYYILTAAGTADLRIEETIAEKSE